MQLLQQQQLEKQTITNHESLWRARKTAERSREAWSKGPCSQRRHVVDVVRAGTGGHGKKGEKQPRNEAGEGTCSSILVSLKEPSHSVSRPASQPAIQPADCFFSLLVRNAASEARGLRQDLRPRLASCRPSLPSFLAGRLAEEL